MRIKDLDKFVTKGAARTEQLDFAYQTPSKALYRADDTIQKALFQLDEVQKRVYSACSGDTYEDIQELIDYIQKILAMQLGDIREMLDEDILPIQSWQSSHCQN